MAADACNWVSQCSCYHVAKRNYITPRPKIGHLESNNPMNLLCLDFTKIDPSRTGKENVLIMTDTFSEFSVAIVTPNQRALTVAKVLVDKWFHVYRVPSRIHSDQGKSFDNDIIQSLCKMYGVEQSLTCPYNPQGNVRGSIELSLTYYVPCQKNKRPIGLSIYHHWCLLTMQHHILLLDFNPTS